MCCLLRCALFGYTAPSAPIWLCFINLEICFNKHKQHMHLFDYISWADMLSPQKQNSQAPISCPAKICLLSNWKPSSHNNDFQEGWILLYHQMSKLHQNILHTGKTLLRPIDCVLQLAANPVAKTCKVNKINMRLYDKSKVRIILWLNWLCSIFECQIKFSPALIGMKFCISYLSSLKSKSKQGLGPFQYYQ